MSANVKRKLITGKAVANGGKFWMVQGSKSSMARVRHPTKKAATDEANRLAGLNPGRPYFVLESVDVAYVAPVRPAVEAAGQSTVDSASATK